MQNARLTSMKNPEALAGAHRVQAIVATDCAFDDARYSENISIFQAFPLMQEACRAPEIGGAA